MSGAEFMEKNKAGKGGVGRPGRAGRFAVLNECQEKLTFEQKS